MIFEIGTDQIEAKCVTYRELNHGQSLGKVGCNFIVKISIDLIDTRFSSDFEQFRKEIIEDFRLTGDREPTSFHDAGLPNLYEIIQKHISTFEEIVKDYLFIEFWEAVLPKDSSHHDFVINEIIAIHKLSDVVEVSGIGFYK